MDKIAFAKLLKENGIPAANDSSTGLVTVYVTDKDLMAPMIEKIKKLATENAYDKSFSVKLARENPKELEITDTQVEETNEQLDTDQEDALSEEKEDIQQMPSEEQDVSMYDEASDDPPIYDIFHIEDWT